MSTCNSCLLEMRVVISAKVEGCVRGAAASQDEAAAACTGWKSYRPQPMPKKQCPLPQLQIVTLGIISCPSASLQETT
jgi:hypothetical protein